MSVVHASVELLEAMRGNPNWWEGKSRPPAACGDNSGDFLYAWVPGVGTNYHDRLAPKRVAEDNSPGPVTCPACIALYPPEIHVRMDLCEERGFDRHYFVKLTG